MAELEFEDILPFVEGEGDTGKTAREKINRNFTKIKPIANVGAEMQQLRQDVADDLEQLHDDVEEMVDKTTSLFGYYNCSTAGATAAKSVQATGYELTTGGNIRIKMEHTNTAASPVTLQIGNAAAKQLYYNNEPVSSDNTWEDNEVVTVYYDGARYQAESAGGDTRVLEGEVEDVKGQLLVPPTEEELPRLEIESGVYVKSNAYIVGAAGEIVSENTGSLSAYTKYAKFDVHNIQSVHGVSSVNIRSYTPPAIRIAIFTASDGTIVSAVSNNAATNTDKVAMLEVEVPSDAYYMYVNVYNNSVSLIPRASVLRQGNAISVLRDKVEALQSSINEEETGVIETTLTPRTMIKSDGTLITNSDYSVTEAIPVVHGSTYHYTGESPQPCVYGYDNDMNAICRLVSPGLNNKESTFDHFAFVIPPDVAYIRACGKTVSNFYVEGTVSVSKLTAINQQLTEIMKIIDNLLSGGGDDGEDSQPSYKEVFREVPLSLNVGVYKKNESTIKSDATGFACTDFVAVTPNTKIYVTCYSNASSYNAMQGYKIVNGAYVRTSLSLPHGTYYYQQEVDIDADTTHIIMNSITTVVPRLFVKEQASLYAPTKKCIHKNVRFVGMSIWYYDNYVSSQVGRLRGYQSLLREQFNFDHDSGGIFCYSANSLGALSADVESSSGVGSSLALKMANNFGGIWSDLDNAIWTLDTITNDFGRSIPIGETNDYDNNTGPLTYYGALRIFADKVVELSGNDAIVIASNSLRRKDRANAPAGEPLWTEYLDFSSDLISGGKVTIKKNASPNSLNKYLIDYEQALMYAVKKNGWYFVDQYRLSGITDNTISLTTLDGLHLNNTGYKLAVLPWIAVFDQIYNKLLDAVV